MNPTPNGTKAARAPARPFRCLTREDLDHLPNPQWIIRDYIPANGLVTLYGPPGAGKSFLAIDWALSICTGEDWLGHTTVAGPVGYVACEGLGGMAQRMAAWEASRQMQPCEASGIFTFPDFGSLLMATSTDQLINAVYAKLPEDNWPAVFIIDTLSRGMAGADENDVGQMNTALNQADRLRAEFNATVLFLHHTTKAGIVERGSTGLRGSCDTMLFLSNKGNQRTLRVTKQRDADEAPPITLKLVPVGASAVLEPTEPVASAKRAGRPPISDDDLAEEAEDLLDQLKALCDGEAVSRQQWMTASQLSKGTFDRRKNYLMKTSQITATEEGYLPK